jgi:hypothetical protein
VGMDEPTLDAVLSHSAHEAGLSRLHATSLARRKPSHGPLRRCGNVSSCALSPFG